MIEFVYSNPRTVILFLVFLFSILLIRAHAGRRR